jgi:DNA-binding NarL/FixJ family response regulator
LVHELDPDARASGRRPRRTARDWVVDFSCFALAVVLGLAAAQSVPGEPGLPHSLAVLDQALGALACAAVWLRRRWPVGLAVAMVPFGFLSNTSGGAAMVALFTLAVHRPFRYGLTATERLRARADAPQVVVLTTFHADEQVLHAVRAGAAGFVLKDTPPAEIVAAVRRVAAGDPVLSPAVTRQLMRHASGTAADARHARARERLAVLNDREREVAVAVGRGLANAQIAAELFMSVATVKTHVSRILAKLDLGNRVQIALPAYDAGLLEDGH